MTIIIYWLTLIINIMSVNVMWKGFHCVVPLKRIEEMVMEWKCDMNVPFLRSNSDSCLKNIYVVKKMHPILHLSFSIQSSYLREFLEVKTIYQSLQFKNFSMECYLQCPITHWNKLSLPYNSENARTQK